MLILLDMLSRSNCWRGFNFTQSSCFLKKHPRIVAQVTLSPDALDSKSARWRLPSFYTAAVQLILPSLPARLLNVPWVQHE